MPAVLSTLTHRKSSESMKEAVGILVSFPPEIISLVLQLMGEDFGRERQNFRLVCRSWDYLISHTSLLWKYIFIDKHSINGPADSKDAFSGTCMALERSGNTHPINLTITLPNDGDNDIHSSRFTVEHATLLASIIFPYTGRIASLCVQGNSHDHYLAALRNTFKLPMPLLRRAILIRDDGLLRPGPDPYYFYDLNTEPNPYPSILQCPQSQDPTVVDEWGMNHYPVLEHLSIVGVPFDYSRFPACNLTELRLVRREWEGNGNESNAQHIVRLLLLCCKTLEVLEVVDFPLDANYHTEDVLDFLKLRSFSFGYRRVYHGVFAFLHNILIDNITELILTNTNVLASLDAGVTPSQRQEIISSAEKEDRLVIAKIMGTGCLSHLEKLTLNCVVFHGNCSDITPSSILREDIKGPEQLEADALEVDVDDYPNILFHHSSSRPLPITLAFIRMLHSLKHLDVRDPSGKFLYFMNYPVAYQSSVPYVRFNLDTLETCKVHTADWSSAAAFGRYRQMIQPVPKMELQMYAPADDAQCWPQFQRMTKSGSQEELWDMTDEWSDVATKLLSRNEELEEEDDHEEEGDDDDDEDDDDEDDEEEEDEDEDNDDQEDDNEEDEDEDDGDEEDSEEGELGVYWQDRISKNPLRPTVLIDISLL